MRIADVAPRLVFPPRNGSSMRMFHLMRHLSERHEIRQFSQPRLPQIREHGFEREVRISETYREYRYANPLSARAAEWCYRSWISQPVLDGAVLGLMRPSRLRDDLRWADVCLVEFPWQFAYCRREVPQGRLVLASHNVEVPTRMASAELAGVSPGKSRWIRYVRKLEEHAVATADLILVVSSEDRDEYVDRYGVEPSRLAEVPNGSDPETFTPLDSEARPALRRRLGLPDSPTVAYIAAIPKPPDLAGLRWVRRVAERLPEVTFLVVGAIVPRPFVEGNVVATGVVEDACSYLQAADVSLCPIQHGGGTKIKVWDSLATGLPTVVFPETVRGTALRHGEHVVVAEKDEAALTGAVRLLLEDTDLAGRLGAAARAFVVAGHDWRSSASRLEAALLELVGRDSSRAD